MDYAGVMKRLEEAGTAQNRKVYARHGVGPAMFGVSYAEQKALAKRLGRDQALAERLWASGNHDARVLATFVAEPSRVTARLIDAWRKDLNNYGLTDALSQVAYEAGVSTRDIDRWAASADDWTGQLGWNLVAFRAMRDPETPDEWLLARLEVIEREVHGRRNRTRYAMNGALIAIGLWGGTIGRRALAVADAVGVIEVDHGETGCKTPDAAAYIRKAAGAGRSGVKKRPRAAAAKKTTTKASARRSASRAGASTRGRRSGA
jgi:3-methyladenine DNA glycosylase AlkD